jgi:putative hydrolase of the HAD superfamily
VIADLSHIDAWLFDLDNTLYPEESEVMALVSRRMTAFVSRELDLPEDEALILQKKYLHDHGTTLSGLMANHGVDPVRFMDEVHDISLETLAPDPALQLALARLPGRRLVFTNGSTRHARRVMAARGIEALFDDVFDIEACGYVPKPHPDTFASIVRFYDLDPARTAFFEDMERNLAPAAQIGMTTVLVGPRALESDAAFVHHRTNDLAAFLAAAKVKEETEKP